MRTRSARRIRIRRAPGLLPTLFECTTTPSLLKELVGGLRPHGHVVSDGLLDELYHRHHGNLRDCLRELYDLYATAAARDLSGNALVLPD